MVEGGGRMKEKATQKRNVRSRLAGLQRARKVELLEALRGTIFKMAHDLYVETIHNTCMMYALYMSMLP